MGHFQWILILLVLLCHFISSYADVKQCQDGDVCNGQIVPVFGCLLAKTSGPTDLDEYRKKVLKEISRRDNYGQYCISGICGPSDYEDFVCGYTSERGSNYLPGVKQCDDGYRCAAEAVIGCQLAKTSGGRKIDDWRKGVYRKYSRRDNHAKYCINGTCGPSDYEAFVCGYSEGGCSLTSSFLLMAGGIMLWVIDLIILKF